MPGLISDGSTDELPGLRTAFLKTYLDAYGPWQPLRHEGTDIRSAIGLFPFKPSLWETTWCLHGDWYITPLGRRDEMTDYLRQFPPTIEQAERYLLPHVTPFERLDLRGYDIVISMQPYLPEDVIARFPSILFCYFQNEHNNHWYSAQMRSPPSGYDCFLDHMLYSRQRGDHSVRTMSMPYLRVPDVLRSVFRPSPGPHLSHDRPQVWLEARTIRLEATGSQRAPWDDACEAYLSRRNAQGRCRFNVKLDYLYRYLRMERTAPYLIPEPIDWTDSVRFFEQLAANDYMISLTAAGAGQHLCDAASVGLICFGHKDVPYHALICHPDCFVSSVDEAEDRICALHGDRDRAMAILAHQDRQLIEVMNLQPRRALRARLAAKRTAAGLAAC